MLIETLKLFCSIVELKSFSRAAEAHYVTPSAVSQQVRALEKQWKTRLLERKGRGASLLPAGKILYKKARTILRHYDALNRLMGRNDAEISGTLRVAAIHGVGLHELPPYIKEFIRLYPKASVKLEYMPDRDVYAHVLKQKADLGIVSFPQARPRLQTLPFRKDKLALVCHPGHPLAKHKAVGLAKISGCSFVAFEKGIPTRKIVDRVLRQNNVPVRIAMEFDNIETLKKAIEVGAGVSILPEVTIQNELKLNTLKKVSISGLALIRPLGILLKKGREMPPSVLKFVDLLTQTK